jgi:hypothetical protein
LADTHLFIEDFPEAQHTALLFALWQQTERQSTYLATPSNGELVSG